MATEFIEGVSADTLLLTAPICAGAGRLLALDLKTYFADEIREFIDSGKPVIGARLAVSKWEPAYWRAVK